MTPDGEPAVGVKVQVFTTPLSTGSRPFRFASTWTDSQGRFRVPIFQVGPAIMWLLPEQAELARRQLRDDKRGNLGTFRLGRGMRITGRVLDVVGRPVPGIYLGTERILPRDKDDAVNLGVGDQIHRAAKTGDDGSFTFGPLPAGSYTVAANEVVRDPTGREGDENPKVQPLPGAYPSRRVDLKEGEAPEPITIQAVPHVAIKARIRDDRPERSPYAHVRLTGNFDGRYWENDVQPSKDGWYTWLAPKGLEAAQLHLWSDNPTRVLFRVLPAGTIDSDLMINLGRLAQDVPPIEIMTYDCPELMIKATGPGGRPINNLQASVTYLDPNFQIPSRQLPRNGLDSAVPVMDFKDDEWLRTLNLAPNQEVEVKLMAEGFAPASRKIRLPERKTEAIAFVLQPN